MLDAVLGKKIFWFVQVSSCFFILGAALEFSMINWTVGETNFYRTFKKRQALDFIEAKKHNVIVENRQSQ